MATAIEAESLGILLADPSIRAGGSFAAEHIGAVPAEI
jgi:hypothetical protein